MCEERAPRGDGLLGGGAERDPTVLLGSGYSNEKMYLFVATALREVGSQMEEDEKIEVVKVDFARVVEMIRENIIEDCKTIAGLLFYLELVKKDSP